MNPLEWLSGFLQSPQSASIPFEDTWLGKRIQPHIEAYNELYGNYDKQFPAEDYIGQQQRQTKELNYNNWYRDPLTGRILYSKTPYYSPTEQKIKRENSEPRWIRRQM